MENFIFCVVAKHSTADVSQGTKYTFVKLNQKQNMTSSN